MSAQGCCQPYLGCVRLVRVRFAALLDEAVVGRVGSQRRGGRHQHSKHSASREAAGDTMSLAASVSVLWRCPTLPQPIGCSTIGAAGLSFQVRNVAGRFPGAVTTTRLFVQHAPPSVFWWGVWVDRGLYSGCGCFASLLFRHPNGLFGWLFSVGPLVPVGSRAPCGASTSGLSTR